MRTILQRVKSAKVSVDGKLVGSCGQGFLVLLGVAPEDTEKEAELLWNKIYKLRVFADKEGKMNKSLADIGGEVLIVSQFTLFANYRGGNRPDFFGSASPDLANILYEYFLTLAQKDCPVGHGIFGADMQVELINDGPVTIAMDTDILKLPKGGK